MVYYIPHCLIRYERVEISFERERKSNKVNVSAWLSVWKLKTSKNVIIIKELKCGCNGLYLCVSFYLQRRAEIKQTCKYKGPF